MSADHSSYEEIARQRRRSADHHEGYDEARLAFMIGQAVRERRLALGLSQTELAAGAGMTQPALSRLEAGGAVPTIPVLERIAVALGAELIVRHGIVYRIVGSRQPPPRLARVMVVRPPTRQLSSPTSRRTGRISASPSRSRTCAGLSLRTSASAGTPAP